MDLLRTAVLLYITTMAPLSPQASRQQLWAQSPCLKNDGISIGQLQLPRVKAVQSIYDAAKKRQHVVVSSPPATGKTLLSAPVAAQ
jgi:hypothetical protein